MVPAAETNCGARPIADRHAAHDAGSLEGPGTDVEAEVRQRRQAPRLARKIRAECERGGLGFGEIGGEDSICVILGDGRMVDRRNAMAKSDRRQADLVEIRIEPQFLGPFHERDELGRHEVGDSGAGGAGAPFAPFPKSVLRFTA